MLLFIASSDCSANSNVSEEEPMCQYVPDATFDHPPIGDAVFSQSLLLLHDGLASGLLLEQYEQLYRRNMYLSIDESKRPENIVKNRYRDIAPCKLSKVGIEPPHPPVLLFSPTNGSLPFSSHLHRRLQSRATDQCQRHWLHQRKLHQHGDSE